ncbi:MAG: tetratricopeptide repeat protein [Acidobacteria bacterium]|nr:tetratricopeptide repeat protein [Acidobacteriota bacterium]
MARIFIVFLLLGGSLYGQVLTGNEKFDQGQYAEAIPAFENVPVQERTAAVMNRLGMSYHMLNRLREAEVAYKAAIRLDNQESFGYNNLGVLYYSQQKFSDAERQIRNALERDPENFLMRRNLRAAKYARENTRKARETAAGVKAQYPLLVLTRETDLFEAKILMPAKDIETATLHERRGDSFRARKMYEDAIIEYRKSMALDRYNASLVNRLGLAYHHSQKVREAEQYYREALKLNPYYLEAMNNIGTIEYIKKNYNRALDTYNKALKLRPESPTVLQNAGACLFALERYEEGYMIYRRALEIDPQLFDKTSSTGTLIQTAHRNDPMLNYYLAKVFAGNGDMERAISYLYKAYEEGFKDLAMLKAEPNFAPLVQDERFIKLIDAITAAIGSPSR